MSPVIGRAFATGSVNPDLAEAIVNGEVELIGIDDIVKRLGVSRSTLERWIRNGGGKLKTPDPLGMQSVMDSAAFLGDSMAVLTAEGKMTFPAPDIYIGSSPKWDKRTVVKWLKQNSGAPAR